MFSRLILIALLAAGMSSCQQHSHKDHDLGSDHETTFQYTSYSQDFEVFAEADAFVIGDSSRVLAHFTTLPHFKALEEGKVSLLLTVDGKSIRQTLEKPTRKGIYSFQLRPETAGKGSITFEITNSQGTFEVPVPDVNVFQNQDKAREAAAAIVVPTTNTAVFTKEQSWKVEFGTGYPVTEAFGTVIKTTALVQATSGNEMIVSAKSPGIVLYSAIDILEGKDVSSGQTLFTISSEGFTENNLSVKYAEALANFEKAKADYERVRELSKERIVAEKELITAQNIYENAKAVYDNLSRNAALSGQRIASPLSGFVKQVFVRNGSYVEAGQAMMVVSQNKSLDLRAEVPQRYASALGALSTANIHNAGSKVTYSLGQLNGRIISYGKAATADNYLIPVILRIENDGSFLPGSHVEVFLKSITNTEALTVPTTALLEEQGIFSVWVQLTPELFEKREVKIGGTDGLRVEIKSGLSEDERIVTRGAMLVKLAQATGSLDAHSGHVH